MAPTSRLEEKLRKLGLSSDDGGSNRSTPASKTKYSFRIYFPQPPYDGIQFNALKSGAGYNFTGQLLGIGGKQLQRIKQESSARVEVVNAEGNLNGAHPDPLDPDLHAYIVADSLSKLHKAANMVWELLQPMNAKFIPIDVVPGGSARLTVAQQKAAPRLTVQQAAATQSVQVLKSSKPQLPHSSQGSATSAALSRPPSISPALTPVTPAAQAGRPGSFLTNCSSVDGTPNSCSSQRASSPALCDTATSIHNISGNRSSQDYNSDSNSSSNACLLLGSLDDFSLPPAAVLSSAPTRTARYAAGSAETSAPTAAAAGAASAGSAAVGDELASCESAHPEQQLMQPPTPGMDAGTKCTSAAASQRCSEGSINRSSCCMTLPSGLMQDLGITVDESLPTTAQQITAGETPAAECANAACEPVGSFPTPDEQPQRSVEPLVNSCSSCFQYGLGLCNSSSFDSSISCSCTDNPALQALLADHQRHLGQMQQLQMQQQVVGSFGSSHGVYDPMAFQSPLIGSIGGSFEGDGFSLGPSALFPTSAPMSRSQLRAFSGQPLQQVQEQQRRMAMPASEGLFSGFGAPAMASNLGSGLEARPADPAGLSQSLPVRQLALSTGMSNTCGSWGAAGELPHTPVMLHCSTSRGTGNFATAAQAARPWMHPQSNMQQEQGMSTQQTYRQYGQGVASNMYGMTPGFDQSGVLSSIW